jgi:hypothetical protein
MAKVLLTGSSGGVGHSARPALEAGGWAVEPFDLTDGKDLRDEAAVLHAMEGCERWCTLEASLMTPPAPPPRSWQLTFWARGTSCKPPKAARSPVSAAPSRVQPRWGAPIPTFPDSVSYTESEPPRMDALGLAGGPVLAAEDEVVGAFSAAAEEETKVTP